MYMPIIGGVLIGLAASGVLYFLGRIAGVSGVAKGLVSWTTPHSDRAWRILFLLGIIVGGYVVMQMYPERLGNMQSISLARLLPGALLVGFGTAMANGCTSGHGVCGLGRKSGRSFVAIILFLTSAVVTTYLLLHVFHIQAL